MYRVKLSRLKLAESDKYMLKATVVMIEYPSRLKGLIERVIDVINLIFWVVVGAFLAVMFWDMFFNGSRLTQQLMVWSWNL